MNVKNNIKQYGFYNSFKRLIKMFLREFGVQYESFWYLVNEINIEDIKQKMQKYSYEDVTELRIDDFKKGDSEIFNFKKIKLIHSRLDSNKYWCYGIFHNSKLIYSTWISKNVINFNTSISKTISLNPNQAILEDSYCHPDYRGQGLHTKMNLFRLRKIYEMDNTEAVAIVLNENKPALRTQLKSGFIIVKTIIFFKVFNNQFYFERKV